MSLFCVFLSCRSPSTSPLRKPQKAQAPAPKGNELSEAEALSLFARLPALPTLPALTKAALKLPQKTAPLPEASVKPLALVAPEVVGNVSDKPAQPVSKPVVAPAPLVVKRITPGGEVGYTSEVYIHFSQPMVPLGAPGEVAKFTPATITPEIKGHWYWKGTDTLFFQSEGRLPMASSFQVKVPAGTKSDSGQALSEAVTESFDTSPVRITEHYPQDRYTRYSTNEWIFIVFDQQIDPATIAKKIEVRANKKLYKTTLLPVSEALTHKHFGKTAAVLHPNEWLALSVVGGLPKDAEVIVSLLKDAPSAEGPRLTAAAQAISFQTYPPLRVESAECSYDKEPCYSWSTIQFNLSNDLNKSLFDPSMVTITPTPEDLSIEPGYYRSIAITGRFLGKTTYQVKLSADIQDTFGQKLSKPFQKSFYIEPDPPSISSVGDNFMILTSNEEDPFIPLYVDNLKSIKVKAYQVAPSDWESFARYMNQIEKKKSGTPPGKLILEKKFAITLDKEGYEDPVEVLLKDLVASKNGNVFIEVEGSPTHKKLKTFRSWIQYTDIAIDSYADKDSLYAMVSDLKSGAPLSGVEVSLYPDGAPSTTDKDGLAKLPLSTKGAQLLLAKTKDDAAFLPAEMSAIYSNNSYYYNYYSDEDETESKTPTFDSSSLYSWKQSTTPDDARWYAASDRKLYQPGEEVKIKGWIRKLTHGKDGDVALASIKEVQYTATDNRGQKIASGSLSVSKLGGFSASFIIPKETPLGGVSVSFGASPFIDKTSIELMVREFRRPEFEVKTTPPTGPLFFGDKALVSVNGSYYAGGPLPKADARWNIKYQFTRFVPPNRRDFSFGYYDSNEWYNSPAPLATTGLTDSEGTHTLKLDMPSPKGLFPYVAESLAYVQDKNRQEWSSSASWLVHPSSVYIGGRTDKGYYFGKEPIQVEAIVVNLEGDFVSGRPIDIKIEQQELEAHSWNKTGKILSTQSCSKTSALALSSCTFANKGNGFYEISLRTTDEQERPALTKLALYVFDDVGWSASSKQKPGLQLLAEKKTYQPGEDAKLLLLAPNYPAEAIITANREGYSLVKRVQITEPSTKITIPMTEGAIGGLYIEARLHGVKTGRVTSLPKQEVATARVEVSSEVRRLAVKVSPESQSLRPGEEATLKVSIRDSLGKVVPNAEVAVIVVDEAILALADDYRLPDPLTPFYPARYSYQLVDSSRHFATLILRGMIGLKGGSGGGGGGAGFGGRSAMGGYPSVGMRSDYRPLAYFGDELITNKDGEVTAKFKLPDNLTRYRVMVVASDEKRFGGGEGTITASLPLMVRPSPPRFLRVRDTFEIPILIQNGTSKEVEVEVAARAVGLLLEGAKGYRVKVPARDRVEVRFPGKTQGPGEAHIQVITVSCPSAVGAGQSSGVGAGLVSAQKRAETRSEPLWHPAPTTDQNNREKCNADAAIVSLPIYSPASTETFATYGILDGNDVLAQSIAVPKNAVEGYGGISITASSTALSGLSDAMLYLAAYPYECSEQLSSKIVAISALRDVLAAFAAKSLPPPKELEEAVQRDIKRLLARQSSDGHFGLWKKDDVKWPFLDLYVTFALVTAREAGFTVPDEALKRALDNIKATKPDTKYYNAQSVTALQAHTFYLRSLLREDVSKEVIAVVTKMSDVDIPTESAALYLASIATSKDAQVKRLQKILYNRSSETAQSAQLTSDSDVESGALILHSSRRTDAIGLLALLAVDAKDELAVKLTKGLLGHRKGGRWSSTQENSWILYALGQYFKKVEGTPPDFTMRLWLGEDFQGEAKFVGYDSSQQRAEIGFEKVKSDDSLTLAKEGTGRLYYRLGLSYLLPEESLAAADYGFGVTRTYSAIEDPKDVERRDGVWYIRAGARVQVEVKMIATSRRYHVALVDPLPAGLEAKDPTLGQVKSKYTPWVRYQVGSWWWEGGNWFVHRSFRAERVEASTPQLEPGDYELSYVALATTPGVFVVPPAYAEEMYAPETFGRSSGEKVIVW